MALINSTQPGLGLAQRIDAHDSAFNLVADQELRDRR
jgi:hypothetical protein